MRSYSSPLLECIPNFSEGRDEKKIQAIAHAIRQVKKVKLLDVHRDPDHHRSVMTFAGPPKAVLEAAFKAVEKASQLIDLRKHRGVHPRMGATDVVPLVPISGITEKQAIIMARQLGKRIGNELAMPVYLYEKAAKLKYRKNLAEIRRGGYEGIRKEIVKIPHRAPDFGPKKIGPAGAVAVGMRFPLIAFNVNLKSHDLSIAKAIAKKIRERDGGLPYVKAIGLALKRRNMVQVSMNVTDYRITGIDTVMAAIKKEAALQNVEIKNTEIVGLIPEKAAEKTQSITISNTKILENCLHSPTPYKLQTTT